MKEIAARNLANALLEEHGLRDKGWRFAFDESKSHFGLCDYRRKVIFLSRIFCLTITDEHVKDTLLHEIAHALTPGHGHDAIWKAKARSIGCTGDRCGNIANEAKDEKSLERFNRLKYKYSYTCPECKNVIYHKKLVRGAICKCKSVRYKIKKL